MITNFVGDVAAGSVAMATDDDLRDSCQMLVNEDPDTLWLK